jgi:single-strand DNA-binding protein
MNTVNKAILVGNVGANPKISTSQKGDKFASFSLATHESWKDKEGNKKQETEWHQIVVFNEYIAAFIEEYVNVGDLIYVEGKIKTREITDKTGKVIKCTEIVISKFSGELVMLSKVKVFL